MLNYPVGKELNSHADISSTARSLKFCLVFIYIQTSCMQAATVLARLRIYADLPEPLLLAM